MSRKSLARTIWTILTLLALGLLTAAVLVACQSSAGLGKRSAKSSSETPFVAPTPAPEVGRVTILGALEPGSWVELRFLQNGQVAEVLAAEGQTVKAGETLARLRASDFSLSISAAEAAVETAKARLAEAAAPPTEEEIAAMEALLGAANAGVNSASAQYSAVASSAVPDAGDIAAAEAAVAAADAQARASQIGYDQIIARSELGATEEIARYQLHANQMALTAAQAQLSTLQNGGASSSGLYAAGSQISQASAVADSIQAQLDLLLSGTQAETIAVVESEVRQAEIALAITKATAGQDEANAALVAPFDGTVVAVGVYQAQSISTENVAFVLADLSQLRVMATADELYIAKIQPGQSAAITFDALPGRSFTGKVYSVAQRPQPAETEDESTLYTVIVTLDKAAPELRWGMRANVSIDVDSAQ